MKNKSRGLALKRSREASIVCARVALMDELGRLARTNTKKIQKKDEANFASPSFFTSNHRHQIIQFRL